MNINNVIGTYYDTLEKDLQNRQTLEGLSASSAASKQLQPAIISGAIAKMEAARQAMGTTSTPVDAQALRDHIYDQVFSGTPEAAKVLKEPTTIHDADNQWSDGPRRLHVQLTGTNLHENMVRAVAHLRDSKSEDSQKYADALADASTDLRKSLAYMQPVPNTFRQRDIVNNRLNHTMTEALQRFDPTSWKPGDNPIPQDLLHEIAVAHYAGNKGEYHEMAQKYRSAGWSVDPSFEEQLPPSNEEAPLNQKWLEYFYGGTPPADLSRFPAIAKEVPAKVRREVYGALDSYPVGAATGDGPAPGLVMWAKQKDAEYQKQQAELAQRAQQIQAATALPPPSGQPPQQQQQAARPRPKPAQSQGSSNAG